MFQKGILFQENKKKKKEPELTPETSSISQASQMDSINMAESQAMQKKMTDEKVQKEKFDQLINRGTRVLYKMSTVWPFDFFTDSITIDVEKITFKISEFFFSSEIRSIYIKNISHIFIDTGPFLASMTILDQSVVSKSTTIVIRHLNKKEALRARRIIQGLIVAHKEKIDFSTIKTNDLVGKLEGLGRMQ